MKIMLHACCGPCSIVPLGELKDEGHMVMGVFENPNIHPYTEWQKRREACEGYFASQEVKLLPENGYAITPWLREVAYREAQRCRYCYYSRLRATALLAKRGRFDAFTTSLLYSKFQKHSLIKELGEAVAEETGVEFLYRDWRDGWSVGVSESKRLGLYRQQYCGCIYSEEERYAGAKSKEAGAG